MLKIEKLEVGQLKSNCYLVYSDKDRKATIIDPGDDADFIQRRINDLELTPVNLIATHGHFDHVLAAYELKLAYNIPFTINDKDEFLLKQMQSSAKYFLGIKALPPAKVDSNLQVVKEVSIGAVKFKIIHTPGHTPGSVSLYSKLENIIFVGDLMFDNGGIGRYDFSYSSKNDLEKSIANILKLPFETIVYSGHGEPFIIADYTSYNNKDVV